MRGKQSTEKGNNDTVDVNPLDCLKVLVKPLVKYGLKFKTPKDLDNALQSYFDTTPYSLWTLAGLALTVGSHQLISDYNKREGYTEYLKRARALVEQSYEHSLRRNGRAGDIFAMKQFNWKDKKEIELAGKVEIPGVALSLDKGD